MRCAALVLACATAGGCGAGARPDPVAEAVKAGLAEQLGVAVAQVQCRPGGCEATLVGGAVVAVRLEGERALTWESEEVVITTALAARIHGELAGLGVEAAVDCGPPRVAKPSEPVRCELAGGGAAWVTIEADDGLAIEIALTAAIVRARTEEVDVPGLDDLSRALDTDEAQGAGPGPEGGPEPRASEADRAGLADAGLTGN